MRTCTRSPGLVMWLPFVVLALTAVGVLCPAPRAQAQGKKDGLKFEIYEDAKKEYRWRLKAAKGESLATASEGYKSKDDAKAGVEMLQKGAGKLKFEIYEDAKKEHRWRAKAPNGQIVAVSSEGYKAKADAQRALDLIQRGAKTAAVVENVKD
jgi:uncharacterized protein YegP (UPF0339 family)